MGDHDLKMRYFGIRGMLQIYDQAGVFNKKILHQNPYFVDSTDWVLGNFEDEIPTKHIKCSLAVQARHNCE